MNIIDSQTADLVRRIEADNLCPTALDQLIRKLVLRLRAACAHPDVVARYQAYRDGFGPDAGGLMEPLPLGEDGYTVSFDPLTQEEQFFQCWQKHGIVASQAAVSPHQCERVIATMKALTRAISKGQCSLDSPDTWGTIPADQSGTTLISRGFFELYHDDVIAALRQSVRVYIHYVLIWGRADLWSTFDRLGIKLPGHEESGPLPLHVDQNPNVHPSFRTVQGVLALSDCPVERGTFVGVPGSRKHFSVYGAMARNQGEYVELDLSNALAAALQSQAQACPLAQGSLISWDSRTTHANSRNLSGDTRLVAYISAGPAAEGNALAVQERALALQTGLGKNVRDALMHASKPPRYTDQAALAALRAPEQLTLLGRLLYGKNAYSEV